VQPATTVSLEEATLEFFPVVFVVVAEGNDYFAVAVTGPFLWTFGLVEAKDVVASDRGGVEGSGVDGVESFAVIAREREGYGAAEGTR
jgi:hypothetical protein